MSTDDVPVRQDFMCSVQATAPFRRRSGSLEERMLHIAILGATGAVGSALAPHLLTSGLLGAADRLSLVGHGTPSTEQRLLAERIDLLDAFDDQRVAIDIVPDIDRFEADIVVVAAGQTVSPEH